MDSLPTVITTSVVRSAHQGESHGGIYLVNLETGKITQKTDWNKCDINWEGRGGDRGLRGIAFHEEESYIAASNEIIVYDREFNIRRKICSHYLKHCHEIFVFRNSLYISSTGFDSVLVFNIRDNRFAAGYCARLHQDGNFSVDSFNPNEPGGPLPGDTLHLNNVHVDEEGLHIAGHQLPFILLIGEKSTWKYGKLPQGTHNARPFNNRLLFNNTVANGIALTERDGSSIQSFSVTLHDKDRLLHNDLPNDHARQGFCRGLCLINDGELIAGGSSPSTISVYSMQSGKRLRQVNLTMDKRNAIHGLEVWPFT